MVSEAARLLKPGGTLDPRVHADGAAPATNRTTTSGSPRYGARLLLERAGLEPLEFVPVGGPWARVGSPRSPRLNRINRGPTRILTELPVRLLYIVLQSGFELLDRLFFDPREVLAHIVVARRRA